MTAVAASALPAPAAEAISGRFRVEHKQLLTPAVAELILQPLDETIPFQAGQYVLLEDLEGQIPPRSYSVANAARPDGRLRLFVTDIPGGQASHWVHQVLSPADLALASGPYGTFTAEPDSRRPMLLLAAGSGLAPALALIEERLAIRGAGETHLFFSARNQTHLLEGERLSDLTATRPGFHFLRTFTRSAGPPPIGRIPRLLRDYYPHLARFGVYISGGPGFVADCAEAALQCGVNPAHLHTEEFFGEPAPW